MSAAFDDISESPQPRHAAEWGFASLLLGGILAILAMMLLQINLHLYLSPPVWGATDLRALHGVTIVGTVVFLGTAGISIAFACLSIGGAYRRRQPTALGWAGLLLSVIALLLWIGGLLDLLAVLDTMMRRQGMGGIF
jgi:hypothetical protein